MTTRQSSTGNVCLYFLAIFLPFVAVLLRDGCGANFFINILLCVLGWIPGVIHAWYIISRRETVRTTKTHRTGGRGGRPVMQQRRRY
ncbi:hypothetical protein B0A52_02010 [Exophiala mesophila]|uniref:Plasma membrane proteolipid 3 n=1 Tax=Exophiala mesophila TaxID=212818 RepID=A0A438NEM9_EXOME|nr:hypothetical protein B0A52_02010 [Exophiala mesophila]